MSVSKADILAAMERRKQNFIGTLFPESGPLRREAYPKHMEFFEGGLKNRVRLMRCANRVGKTIAGCYELTMHLTGNYPEWWKGKKFSRPINALAAGESGKLTRDSLQLKLLGPPSAIGTGLIPYAMVDERRAKAGIADAVDTVRIKHKSGGLSTLQFQSFDQGREAFQATERDVILLDEEPALSIYSEAVTRTMTTGGIVMMTFTPLKGMSETVAFMDTQFKDGKCLIITATWDDAPHLSDQDKAEMLANYPPHQRDARSKGIPQLGSGAIYPIPEEEFKCQPFEFPPYWRRAYAMDVGWNRTAALWGAIDDQNDIVYIYSEHYRGQAEPSIHAEAVKSRDETLFGVIDPASRGRSQKDGEQLLDIYKKLGLLLTPADNGVEAGIHRVFERLSIGKLKVFSTCQHFFEEYRVYRRDENGKIVKENDHLMDCLRYFCASATKIASMPKDYISRVHNLAKIAAKDYDPLSPYNYPGAQKRKEFDFRSAN